MTDTHTSHPWHSDTYVFHNGVKSFLEIVFDLKTPLFHEIFDEFALPDSWINLKRIENISSNRTKAFSLKVSKSQKHFILQLHCPKNERNIRQILS